MYNAYNPAIIIKMLDIYRVLYNYIEGTVITNKCSGEIRFGKK